jgi:hypothetical protein
MVSLSLESLHIHVAGIAMLDHSAVDEMSENVNGRVTMKKYS